MSIKVEEISYFWRVAASLSEEQKVFITSGEAERCVEVYQQGVTELVFIGESSPAEGIKARNDYRERRSSKDLIIDVTGEVDIEVVQKLLKKRGLFLSRVRREWSDQFSQVYGVAWVESEEGEELLEYVEEDFAEALFWIGSRSSMPALPLIEREREGEEESVDELLRRIDELEADLKRAERSRSASKTHYRKAKERISELESVHAETASERDLFKAELTSARRKVTRAEKAKVAHQALQAEHNVISLRLEEQSATLAEREAQYETLAQSVETLRDAHEVSSAELKEAHEEIAKLREQLTLAERSLALNISVASELSTSRSESERATQAYQMVATAWSSWLGEGLTDIPPPPPLASLTLVEGWVDQLLTSRPFVTATLSEHQELSELRASLSLTQTELTRVTEERDTARLSVDDLRTNAGIDVGALRESLEAERALRRAQERELSECRAQLQETHQTLNTLYAQGDAKRDERLKTAERSGLTHTETARLLMLESQRQVEAGQRQARTRLLEVSHQLQLELTARLEEEIVARAQLKAELSRSKSVQRELELELSAYQGSSLQVSAEVNTDARARLDTPVNHDARLNALSDQLKRDAHRRSQKYSESQGEVSQQLKPTLNTASARDLKRVKQQAKRLKQSHQSSSTRPESASTLKRAESRPERSAQERSDHARRAQEVLKERLNQLGRQRRESEVVTETFTPIKAKSKAKSSSRSKPKST